MGGHGNGAIRPRRSILFRASSDLPTPSDLRLQLLAERFALPISFALVVADLAYGEVRT